MKLKKKSFLSLLLVLSLVILSSCGIGWENYEQDINGDGKPVGKINISKNSDAIMLSKLTYDSPQLPISFKRMAKLTIDCPSNISPNNVTLKLRHKASKTRILQGDASGMLGTISFFIPSGLNGKSAKTYEIIQNEDELNATTIELDGNDTASYTLN